MSSGTESSSSSLEITTTECAQCRTQISGVEGRYSCSGCGWVNHYSEGHNELPTAEDDDRSHGRRS